jgi:hypothetical protein
MKRVAARKPHAAQASAAPALCLGVSRMLALVALISVKDSAGRRPVLDESSAPAPQGVVPNARRLCLGDVWAMPLRFLADVWPVHRGRPAPSPMRGR